MVNYTIDKKGRAFVYYVCAIMSILLTPVLNSLIELIAKKHKSLAIIANFHLTGFLIFGFLIFLFTTWLWKFKPISGIPNLNGIWEGNYLRYNEGEEEMPLDEIIQKFEHDPNDNKIRIIIEQNWLRMSLIYRGHFSESTSSIIDMKIENSKVYSLQWMFDSKDRTGITPSNKYGIGCSNASINVLENKDIMEGTYFTKKGRKGFFRVKRIETTKQIKKQRE